MIKFFSLFFLFFMTTLILPGQSGTYLFYHKTYTMDDGISSRFIHDIYQDSQGFIWVTSNYGVDRFDGEKFRSYNQGKYKLQSDNISDIREDQASNLWLIDRSSYYKNGVQVWRKIVVNILDPDKDKIIGLEDYFKEGLPFQWSTVVNIVQDESYAIWITTSEGKVYCYTDCFTEIQIDSDLIEGGVLYTLTNSELLILGPGRVIKLDKDRKLVYDLAFKKSISNVVSKKDGTVFLIVDTEKVLYKISHSGELALFRGIDKDNIKESIVNRFGIDSEGRVWIEEADAKISVYDKGARVLNTVLDKFELGASSNNRLSFMGDKNGGIWYSDLNGLNYISLNKSGFKIYFEHTDISLRKIIELSDSTFFINTYRGYYHLDKKTGYYKNFDIPGYNGYSQGGILRNGFIYNSLYTNKVLKINVAEQTAEHLEMNVAHIEPKTFILMPDSTILIGANSGLFTLDPAIDSIMPFKKYNEFNVLKERMINSFVEVEGLVYIHTDNGMFVLDWEKGIIARHDFVFNHLLNLHVDEDGIFWIVTRGGGLLEWHRKEAVVHQYTVDEGGLSHDVIYAIYSDTLNQLWLPSSRGLMRFNKIDKTVVTFLRENGMKDNEFNQYAHYQDADGKLYMGGANGLVGFWPKDLSTNEEINCTGKIVATEITVSRTDNKTYELPVNAINNGETLVIKGNIKSTSIKFSLLEYDRLESSQYYYKIEGIHDRWQPMKDQYIRLIGLPGGTHNILIKVDAGIKMETHYSSVKVQILRPFTNTWWFFGLCALGFLVLGISLSRYRIYRLDQINRSLERKVKRRTQRIENDKILISQQYHEMEQINKTKDHLIAIIGHDLKDYVSTFEGIEKKINYLITSKQVERIPQLVEFIENSAHDLSLLLDNLLNWALKERGDLLLHPDSVKVDSILRDVLKRLNKSIDKKEITLISKIPEDLIVYVDGLTLHSLLRNIIHNAIKFSYRKGIVKIYHTKKGDFVTLHIQDKGIGIAREQVGQLLKEKHATNSTRGTENEAGTGMGLLLCQEMLEMQSGTLEVSSKIGEGTTFSIVLPKRILNTKSEVINV